ncbi:MFS transporter [Kineococcus rhizosphaerae]|uniref:Putative MFS family arabinose efflux permease n=1 Tax=Kineococcus rhizosphaerae TaxID=559628 RepID=A0A2T0R506_9ACTN|nr:MFS transporter [Kineococcus rhizosphaerae]PRY15824.1 putative MFS family arabinose efflux permease [Kineococcus rhizosphaerae]
MSTTTPTLLSRYARLPHLAGRAYLPVTGLGRLPITMVPLAVLGLVTSSSGSVAVGGLASAAAAVGEAVGVPVVGWFADRRGQRNVLLTVVALHLLALAGLFTALAGAGTPTVLAAAAGVGFTLPSVSGFSRARWLRMAEDPHDVATAFAAEGTIDEATFILGPALVGIVGVLGDPAAALLTSAGLTTVFVTAFACHRTHRRTAPLPRTGRAAAGRVPWAVAVPVLAMLCMGTVFGATQTGVTAAAEAIGSASLGSLVYALSAVGSTATTLCLVLLPDRFTLRARWAVCGAGLALGAVLMAATAQRLGTLAAAVLLLGLFVGPALVTVNTVAARLAPAGRGAFLMALLNSGVVLGVATGASAGGALAEHAGPAWGFAVVGVAGALLAATALVAPVRR